MCVCVCTQKNKSSNKARKKKSASFSCIMHATKAAPIVKKKFPFFFFFPEIIINDAYFIVVCPIFFVCYSYAAFSGCAYLYFEARVKQKYIHNIFWIQLTSQRFSHVCVFVKKKYIFCRANQCLSENVSIIYFQFVHRHSTFFVVFFLLFFMSPIFYYRHFPSLSTCSSTHCRNFCRVAHHQFHSRSETRVCVHFFFFCDSDK